MEKKNKKNVHEITVKFEGETWEKALNKSFQKNNKNAKIDGFRPGKAPYDIFIKHYGIESLFSDAIDSLVNEAYLKALDDSKLVPVVEPKVDLKEVSEEGVEFVFTITTKPEVNIKKYKDLKVKKEELVVTDEEINHEIEHLLEHYAELVIKEGKLEKGDTAKISNLAYITPFLSLIWTALILKESFNIYSILGLIVIVLGIFIQMKDKKENMSTINKQG